LWKDRHCEEDRQYSEQQLAGQVNSVLRRNVFTDLELVELKRVAIPSAVPSTRETSDYASEVHPPDVAVSNAG